MAATFVIACFNLGIMQVGISVMLSTHR